MRMHPICVDVRFVNFESGQIRRNKRKTKIKTAFFLSFVGGSQGTEPLPITKRACCPSRRPVRSGLQQRASTEPRLLQARVREVPQMLEFRRRVPARIHRDGPRQQFRVRLQRQPQELER